MPMQHTALDAFGRHTLRQLIKDLCKEGLRAAVYQIILICTMCTTDNHCLLSRTHLAGASCYQARNPYTSYVFSMQPQCQSKILTNARMYGPHGIHMLGSNRPHMVREAVPCEGMLKSIELAQPVEPAQSEHMITA
jgi:hypothetical protein